jgi:AMP-polyphosphate phosphotransferase
MVEIPKGKNSLDKKTYADKESAIRISLLKLQRQIIELERPVIIIVGGTEGAGKGEVINLLDSWFDTRKVEIHAYWDETDEESDRPRLWRYWRNLPAKSKTAMMLGAWYSGPIVARVLKQIDRHEFERQLIQIVNFERLLRDDDVVIVKFRLDISKKTQLKRLKKKDDSGRSSRFLSTHSANYAEFKKAGEAALSITHTGFCPWIPVSAENKRQRNLQVGERLIDVLNREIASSNDTPNFESLPTTKQAEVSDLRLEDFDLTAELDKKAYKSRLESAQNRLQRLAWDAYDKQINTVCVFEGPDGAGKGGAIRRLSAGIDARLLRVISTAAPNDEERAHHYLWRFWRNIPRSGYCTIYDRSWYGRVLVERVEQFCKPEQWARSYQEINEFEQQLIASGTVVLKFWVQISFEEQLRRFEERQKVPWKHHKITDEDWRNRDRWADYALAVNDMVARTSTPNAPWTLVPGNDKRYARIQIIEALCDRLQGALE